MPETPLANDKFQIEWDEAREYWRRIHRIYDYDWLFYNGIILMNDIYGEKYLKAFGLQVNVPRTLMTVEALKAQMFNRKIEFAVDGLTFKDAQYSDSREKLLNGEWKRSKADYEVREAGTNALIFGNGYVFNPYLIDEESQRQLKDETAGIPAQDPTDGKPQEATHEDPESDEWDAPKVVIRYQGVKLKNLNPYYTFTDPQATCDADRRHVYLYTIFDVDDLREQVVTRGWLSTEEAADKIKESPITRFDNVRDQFDVIYQQGLTPFNRGDHAYDAQPNVSFVEKTNRNLCALIERFSPNGYECRISGQTVALHADYNVYAHKEIPIITFWDLKLPNEFRGRGEPEIIRHQQIEENKIHNLTLQATLMAIVQRYAINPALLEDESDASFSDPFAPIRLKMLPGNSLSNAIMALSQPDVKQTPFELMDLVKQVIQQVTGANDFVISASNAVTDTATESNNLVAASAARIRAKLVLMDESLVRIAEQWMSNFAQFYGEELDFQITGDKSWYKYLPYNRDKNEDLTYVTDAIARSKEVDGRGATGTTLEEVYINLGFKGVVFISDIQGKSQISVRVIDSDMNLAQTIERFMKALNLMIETNKAAEAAGEPFRFDVFKLGKEMLRNFPMIQNVEDYVKNLAPTQPQPMPGDMGAPQGQPAATAPVPIPTETPAMPNVPSEAVPPAPNELPAPGI